MAFDVVDGRRLANQRFFASIEHNKLVAGPDGVNGVHVFAPDGTRLGVILLPETCANVCFGGTTRNRLFMTATTSL